MNRLRRIRPALLIASFVFGIAILLFYAFIVESYHTDKTGRLMRSTDSKESKFHYGIKAEERRAYLADTYDQYVASRGTENRAVENVPAARTSEPTAPAAPTSETAAPEAPAAPAAPAEVKTAAPAEARSAAPAAKAATTPESAAPAIKAVPEAKTVDEVDLLARLITAEAQAEPYEAKVAVGAVVLNRVQSGLWANSIKEVIYQKINGYYQFTPVQNGWIDKPAEAESIKAARVALSGADPTNGAQFYYDDMVTNTWILAKPVSVQYGHMIFAF